MHLWGYENERGFLVGTCYDGQDTYKALIILWNRKRLYLFIAY